MLFVVVPVKFDKSGVKNVAGIQTMNQISSESPGWSSYTNSQNVNNVISLPCIFEISVVQ